jgi:hypothetical protein
MDHASACRSWTSGGCRRSFGSGDVLCLRRLSLRLPRNRGHGPVLLTAVSRRR